MTITIFVPDWKATESIPHLAAKRAAWSNDNTALSACSDRIRVERDFRCACDVIVIDARYEVTPPDLKSVPMIAIILYKSNAPVTRAIEGRYIEGAITARVETSIKDGVPQQSIRVEGQNGTTLEELNDWFDKLAAGAKNGHAVSGVAYSIETQQYIGSHGS